MTPLLQTQALRLMGLVRQVRRRTVTSRRPLSKECRSSPVRGRCSPTPWDLA